jgi:hypothetical protein
MSCPGHQTSVVSAGPRGAVDVLCWALVFRLAVLCTISQLQLPLVIDIDPTCNWGMLCHCAKSSMCASSDKPLCWVHFRIVADDLRSALSAPQKPLAALHAIQSPYTLRA